MTNNQTISWVIGLVFYFLIITVITGFVQNDVPIESGDNPLSFCKNLLCTEKTFVGNLLSNISDVPLWFNLVFLGIPFLMLTIFLILLALHG